MERRTAPELWRDALDATRRPTPAYLEETAGRLAAGVVAEADGADRRARATGCSRTASGTATRSRCSRARGSSGSCSTGRSCRSAPSSSASIPTSSAKECAYVLEHSEAVLAFAEDDEQTRKLASVRGSLPALREIVPFDRLDEARGRGPRRDGTCSRSRSPRTTSRRSSTRPARPGRRRAACSRTGTSSPRRLRVERRLQQPGDVVLLFLPLAHSFGRLAHQAGGLHGATVACVADVARVPEALAAVRPTILPAVPRVYEKIHANALGEIERAGGRGAGSGSGRSASARRASRARRAGRRVPALLAPPGARRRPARLREGARAARRQAPPRRLRRRAALDRRDGVLPRPRRAGDRGLRPDRDLELGDRERPGRLPHRDGRPAGRRQPRSGSPRTARSSSAATPSSPATTRSPRRPRRRSPRTAGSAPATSARSTRTASSRSPTARRT